jgi:Flp pilus assembly pilin Flp
MWERIKNIFRDEDGAVTVDWVVLCAAVVGLAGATIASLHGPTGDVSSALNNSLSNSTVAVPVGGE